ncbi:YadA C-terminal domain-containing protein [Haemophilus haemolyticus]|uniref:YadA C-terminal domain-containing protein n=1 Tax=Haemophilus haemolyticus TaxID=726 RepID=UPI0011276A3D|nr:YadA C-terminal domain-containing protein [Haemophilus haemolyticus]TPG92313.1 hypothetical protein EUX45_05195 [Haemophilus haemolyticus]
MKYELLKRTAIALFVGGVISSYTVAADDSLDTATTNFTKAIKEEVKKQTDTLKAEQDKKVEEISSDLTGVATDLVGVAANSYNNTLTLNGFKAGDDLYDIDPKTEKVTKKPATEEDVKNDPLEGKGVVATVIKNKDSLEDLSEDLGNLEDKVDGIVKTAANKDDLGKLNDAVVKLQEDTNEHTDILNNNSEDIAANKEAIDINKQDIETLKKSDQYRDLIKVKDLVENKADKKALELVNNDVEKNTQLIRENKASIKAKAGKDYVDQELAKKANSADVTDKLNQKVDQSTLDAYNNSLVTAIGKKADQTDVDANKVEISKKANSADVTAKLNQKVDQSTLDTYNNSLVTAIGKKADQTDVDANKVEIAKKANSSDVYTKDEANNRFVQIENNVGNNVTSISQNRANVTTNASNIAHHNVRLNTLDSRVDKLDNRVNKLDKDLKRGLAAQAALTGLFQPYTVGKANFTAAVGGYKSQTAVAVGTGYRYNQNIATKAGVAFSQGGGVTYNAGVNFEW